MSAKTHDVTFRILYGEKVFSPRCKNPRALVKCETVTLPLVEVEEKDAPVALRVIWNEKNKAPVDYRLYHGKLYCEKGAVDDLLADKQIGIGPYSGIRTIDENWSFTEKPITKDLVEWKYSSARSYPLEDQITEAQNWIDSHLIVDGVAYKQTKEPGYDIDYNLAFGGWWSCHISPDGEYNANEFEYVSSRADKVREEWPKAYVVVDGRIEVLIPEAVTQPTHKEQKLHHYLTEAAKKVEEVLYDTMRYACGFDCQRNWVEGGFTVNDTDPSPCTGCFFNETDCAVKALQVALTSIESDLETLNAKIERRSKRDYDLQN